MLQSLFQCKPRKIYQPFTFTKYTSFKIFIYHFLEKVTEKPRIICRFFGRNPIKAPRIVEPEPVREPEKEQVFRERKTVRTTNKRVIILCGHEVNSNMSNCLKNTVIFRLEIKPFKIDLYFFFFYGFRVNVLFAIKDIIKRIRKPCNFRYSSKL